MSEPIDYPALLRHATLGLVREVLERTELEGALPGEHHFFLTFRTAHPGARVPAALARRFPDTMTIVLQHQFWDLAVDEDGFEVTLRFGTDHERLRVPFDALTAFLDPSVPFGLDFTQFTTAEGGEGAGATALATEDGSESGAPAGEGAQPGAAHGPTNADGLPATGGDPDADKNADVLPFRRKES